MHINHKISFNIQFYALCFLCLFIFMLLNYTYTSQFHNNCIQPYRFPNNFDKLKSNFQSEISISDQEKFLQSCNDKICMHGVCFLGKCFCNDGSFGPYCKAKISKDSCQADSCFYSEEFGVPFVDEQRWSLAQSEELSLWADCKTCVDDGWQRHQDGFKNYQDIQGPLNSYIEIGCGPFTQTINILQNARPDLFPTVTTLTLLDPNLFNYVRTVQGNTYKDGKLLGKRVLMLGLSTEDYSNVKNTYDTLTVINVAEHTQSIFQHLENIYYMLKPGGQLIFHDRAWPHYNPSQHHDVDHRDWLFHPTRAKAPVFDHFIQFFEHKLLNVFTTGDPLSPTAYYMIGFKKNLTNI